MPEIAIIGGGLTGLSTAHHLGRKDWCIYEKENRAGGLCRTESRDGFLFDYTGHWLHMARPETRTLVNRLLAANLEAHVRDTWIHSQGTYTRYPFQSNTYGLPVETVRECLLGFIEAHCRKGGKRPHDFQEWILQAFGKGIARHFMIPYNTKLWTVPPRRLSCDWLGKYVPKPDLEQVITGALTDQASGMGYNASFHYPKKGGIQSLVDAFLASLPGKRVQVSHEIVRVDLRKKVLVSAGGETHPFEKLVVTSPLRRFVELLSSPPPSTKTHARTLKHNRVVNFNFGLSRQAGDGMHWVYFPESKYPFYRVGFPSNICPSMAPPGAGSLYTEVAFRGAGGLPEGELRQQVVRGLVRAGILRNAGEITTQLTLHIPCAYVIFDHDRRKAFTRVRSALAARNVFVAGRYGAWEYSAMEDAILWGQKAARWAREPRA
jgi:protoporphyrinogen oxidase